MGGVPFLAGLLALLMPFLNDAEDLSGAGPRLIAVCVIVVGAAIILFGSRKIPQVAFSDSLMIRGLNLKDLSFFHPQTT